MSLVEAMGEIEVDRVLAMYSKEHFLLTVTLSRDGEVIRQTDYEYDSIRKANARWGPCTVVDMRTPVTLH
jgi:hypothetical protein